MMRDWWRDTPPCRHRECTPRPSLRARPGRAGQGGNTSRSDSKDCGSAGSLTAGDIGRRYALDMALGGGGHPSGQN